MYWIRVDVSLPTHRKTLELGAALGEPLAIGYMVRLWCWARFSTPDGKVSGRKPGRTVEAAVGWTGKPGAFVAAALETGFLRADGDALIIHDWEEHNGKALQKAKDGAARTRRWRENREAKLIQEREAKLAAQAVGAQPPGENQTASAANASATQTRTEGAANGERDETSRDVTERDATGRNNLLTTTKEVATAAGTPPPLQLEAQASGAAQPRKLSPAQKGREDLRAMRATAFPGVVDDVEIKPAALTTTFDRLEKEASAKGATLVEAYSAYLRDDFARSRNPPCPLSLFVDGNKFRECLSAALRGRGAGPALTLVSGHKAGGYASQAEIEAQAFTVDRYDEPIPEGA